MHPPNWPDRLESERLLIRLYELADAPAYLHALETHRAYLARALGWGPDRFGDLAWAEDQMRMRRKNHAGRVNLPLAIFSREDGAFLGSVGLVRPNWAERRSEIGLWMLPTAQRQGYAAEACLRLMTHAFEAMDLARIDLYTRPDNGAVHSMAQRFGFTFDGLIPPDPPLPGEPGEMAAYHMDREGWLARPSDAPSRPG